MVERVFVVIKEYVLHFDWVSQRSDSLCIARRAANTQISHMKIVQMKRHIQIF